MAYLHTGSFDEAKSDLLHANELCPNDPSIKEGFKLYKQKKAEYHEKSKRIASQVFNKKTWECGVIFWEFRIDDNKGINAENSFVYRG